MRAARPIDDRSTSHNLTAATHPDIWKTTVIMMNARSFSDYRLDGGHRRKGKDLTGAARPTSDSRLLVILLGERFHLLICALEPAVEGSATDQRRFGLCFLACLGLLARACWRAMRTLL